MEKGYRRSLKREALSELWGKIWLGNSLETHRNKGNQLPSVSERGRHHAMGIGRARQIITAVTSVESRGSALVELILTVGLFFTAIALQRERLATWHRRLADLEKWRWQGEGL
jgi:hypothetical protein